MTLFFAYFRPPPLPLCHLVTLAPPNGLDVAIFILKKSAFFEHFWLNFIQKETKNDKRHSG